MAILYLLRSRKFWVAVLAIISQVSVALGYGEIDPALATAITVIASVLIAAIAGEDMARAYAVAQTSRAEDDDAE
jgi:hypothetical protein